jgi:hypothetical protein
MQPKVKSFWSNALLLTVAAGFTFVALGALDTGAGKNSARATGRQDSDGAMRQAQELLDAYRAANWNHRQVPEGLWRLPDQVNHENASLRVPGVQSFILQKNFADVYDNKLAFYSDLYVRMNPQYVDGDRVQANPSGFAIVGWRDGTVDKVPWQQIRFKPVTPGSTQRVWVFPGVSGYQNALTVDDVGWTWKP